MVGSQAHLSAPGPWSMRVPVLREGRDARAETWPGHALCQCGNMWILF